MAIVLYFFSERTFSFRDKFDDIENWDLGMENGICGKPKVITQYHPFLCCDMSLFYSLRQLFLGPTTSWRVHAGGWSKSVASVLRKDAECQGHDGYHRALERVWFCQL